MTRAARNGTTMPNRRPFHSEPYQLTRAAIPASTGIITTSGNASITAADAIHGTVARSGPNGLGSRWPTSDEAISARPATWPSDHDGAGSVKSGERSDVALNRQCHAVAAAQAERCHATASTVRNERVQ